MSEEKITFLLELAENALYEEKYDYCNETINQILAEFPNSLLAKVLKIQVLYKQDLKFGALNLMHKIVLEYTDEFDLLDKLEESTWSWHLDEKMREGRLRSFNLYHILNAPNIDELKDEYNKKEIEEIVKSIKPLQNSVRKLESIENILNKKFFSQVKEVLDELEKNTQTFKNSPFFESHFGNWIRDQIVFVITPTIRKLLSIDKNLYQKELNYLLNLASDLDDRKGILIEIDSLKNPINCSISPKIKKEIQKNENSTKTLVWIITIIIVLIAIFLH
ncbi:hypothetical protein KAI58_01405 [Candidatus Gracilibacteria bacterium]|nr:hypothetical protein [Candidatus Gracilibacteria bacterium]